MENESITLSICVDETYREILNRIKSVENQRKCRLWIDLLEPVDGVAEVEVTRNGIVLRCNTRKGMIQESCTYDSVLGVTEWEEGIFLRISHKRMLLIPVTDCAEHNRSVMDAMLILSQQCRYLFKRSKLSLDGVPLSDRIRFRIRPRQGFSYAAHPGRYFVTAIILFSLFLGTLFITEPYRNVKIEPEDALMVSGTVEKVRINYRRGIVREIHLDLTDGESFSISGSCTGSELAERVERLPGKNVHFLVRPGSNYVLQIESGEQILLDFDVSQEQMWKNAVAFAFLGILMYAGSIYLIYELVFRKKR